MNKFVTLSPYGNTVKKRLVYLGEGGHIAPRGAKKEEAFGGVILKSERPSGALFTNSGPPFFTVESRIEVLSPLMPSFQDSGPHFFKLLAQK